MRTLITTIAIGLAVVAPAAAAQAREPVTRIEVIAAAHHLADQSAATAENHPATGIEDLTKGRVVSRLRHEHRQRRDAHAIVRRQRRGRAGQERPHPRSREPDLPR